MRTSLFTFASLSLISFAALASLSLGCAAEVAAPSADDETTATSEAELSMSREAFVLVRRDARRCMAPLCGGYYVHEVNLSSTKETYVSGLDLSLAGLDDASVAKVWSAPAEELLLKGKLGTIEKKYGTRAFLVTEAYRGMPGVAPVSGEAFWQAHVRTPAIQCFAAPCNNELALKLGAKAETAFTTLSVACASKPFVDQAWLAHQVTTYGAIVAATMHNGAKFPAGYEKVLDASQVFLKLPLATPPCPMFPLHQCPEGQLNTFSRSADLCSIPTGCATRGICSMAMPACADGYTLASWAAAPSACPAYACDPSFLSE
jgi:hypothetical protein